MMTMRRATLSFALVIAIALMVCACKQILSQTSTTVVPSSYFNTNNSDDSALQGHKDLGIVQLEPTPMEPNDLAHVLRGSSSYQRGNIHKAVEGNNAEQVSHINTATAASRKLGLDNLCRFHDAELFVGDPPPYPEILLVNFTMMEITFEFSFIDNITQAPNLAEMHYFMETTRQFFIDYMLSPYLEARPLHEDFDEFTLEHTQCKIKHHEREGHHFPLRITVDATIYYDLHEDPLHRPMSESDVIDAIVDSFEWDDYVKDYLWRDSEEGRASVWNQIKDVFFAWKLKHEQVHPKETGI